MIRIIFTIIAIFLVLAIARESIGWALITGAFLFCILCWLNNEPDSVRKRNRRINAATHARDMNDLINQK